MRLLSFSSPERASIRRYDFDAVNQLMQRVYGHGIEEETTELDSQNMCGGCYSQINVGDINDVRFCPYCGIRLKRREKR